MGILFALAGRNQRIIMGMSGHEWKKKCFLMNLISAFETIAPNARRVPKKEKISLATLFAARKQNADGDGAPLPTKRANKIFDHNLDARLDTRDIQGGKKKLHK